MTQLLNYTQQTDSTNNRLKQLIADGCLLPDLYTIYTFFQTAGRGQQGNSWESEEGKNLLFSTLIKPRQLPATEQFRLSMLAPLAIVNVVNRLFQSDQANSFCATIKWPNDIYVADRKLAGILIENTLAGNAVSSSVVGVGLNVNQLRFISPAPNPVSLCQLTGKHYDLHLLMQQILMEIEHLLPLLQEPEQLKQLYMQHLYRASGFYPYEEREVSLLPVSIEQSENDKQFLAKIEDIDNDGCLCLRLKDQSIRRYHFKQLRYVIIPDIAVSSE